jgi:hypothetical protein
MKTAHDSIDISGEVQLCFRKRCRSGSWEREVPSGRGWGCAFRPLLFAGIFETLGTGMPRCGIDAVEGYGVRGGRRHRATDAMALTGLDGRRGPLTLYLLENL